MNVTDLIIVDRHLKEFLQFYKPKHCYLFTPRQACIQIDIAVNWIICWTTRISGAKVKNLPATIGKTVNFVPGEVDLGHLQDSDRPNLSTMRIGKGAPAGGGAQASGGKPGEQAKGTMYMGWRGVKRL